MRYKLAPIFCRPWLLNGLSTRLIESHYENNYGGALRRLNAITEKLESLEFAKTPGYVINGLKREELIALNSTLLHELYFASLGVAPVAKGRNIPRPAGALAEALRNQVPAGLTLFIVAKSLDSPGPPVAVNRLLRDGMGMRASSIPVAAVRNETSFGKSAGSPAWRRLSAE